MAVASDEKDTFVTTKIGNNDWGKTIGNATIAGVAPVSAAIAFPDDYDINAGDCILFMAISTGSDNGDVYKVNRVRAPDSSVATDLNIGSAYTLNNVDVTALAVSGNTTTARLLAGAASSAQVYISTDGGTNWTRSAKEPTGQHRTSVLMAPDFTNHGRAYAATSGTESAFSYTTDGGVTWNQLSLIDTKLSTIIDLAVSPNYRQDNTLFMLTFNGEHSLWRSSNGGTTWERVLTSTLANIDSIKLVELSPRYSTSSQVVFLAGQSSGNPAIWKSTNNGQTFTLRTAPYLINTWAVANNDTLFIGGYDGSKGLVYRATDSGFSTGVAAGSQSLNSIVLSPNYEQDKTILVGNTTGQVYWSDDNGASFEPLGQQLPLTTGVGKVTIAFDPKFSSNKTVYAASEAKSTTESKERIYRFIIGESNAWKSIDSTLPVSAMINQLIVSSNDTFYATNSQSVNAAKKEGGMERSLDATYPLSPTFETVTGGLDDGATLTGLWVCKNQLWSIDTKNTRLMTYTDTLSVPVILALPPDETPGIDTGSARLEWVPFMGATEYEWQLDYETDFSSVPDKFKGNTEGNSTRLPTLEPATTYYWRVRATKPVLSPWSAKYSFHTTSLGTTAIAPSLRSPGAAARGVELKPIFQWSDVGGADKYELLVSTSVSFTNPTIQKTGADALPATAWQCDTALSYDTTYYWKVRAVGSNSYSAWSAVSAFTTELPPVSQSPATESPASGSPASGSPASGSLPSPPLTVPTLASPQAGANEVPLKPIFQWSAIAGADSYELLVSTDVSFANPIIVKIGDYALPATAWQSDINLDYNTAYYWKVRAAGSNSHSAWSAVSAFITEPPPEPPPAPELSLPSPMLLPPPPSPAPPTLPDWVIYLAVALLLTTVILLITLLVLVVGIRQS